MFENQDGLDEKSVAFLLKAIEKNNLKGFDYIEYKQSLRALADMKLDEETAFKSAFATAKTMGLTKEILLKTAEHYKVVLGREKEQFEAAVNKQMSQQVKVREKEVEKLRKIVEDHKTKIAELEKEIKKATTSINDKETEIKGASEKIKSTQASFENTLQALMVEIEKDVTNIKKYL